MQRDEAVLLDILQAARLVRSFVSGVDRTAFGADLKTQSAVLHQLLILGEATKRLSEEFRGVHSEVPWKQMAGMRDRLIHGYHDVNLDIVWTTVEQELPGLVLRLEEFAPKQPG